MLSYCSSVTDAINAVVSIGAVVAGVTSVWMPVLLVGAVLVSLVPLLGETFTLYEERRSSAHAGQIISPQSSLKNLTKCMFL